MPGVLQGPPSGEGALPNPLGRWVFAQPFSIFSAPRPSGTLRSLAALPCGMGARQSATVAAVAWGRSALPNAAHANPSVSARNFEARPGTRGTPIRSVGCPGTRENRSSERERSVPEGRAAAKIETDAPNAGLADREGSEEPPHPAGGPGTPVQAQSVTLQERERPGGACSGKGRNGRTERRPCRPRGFGRAPSPKGGALENPRRKHQA